MSIKKVRGPGNEDGQNVMSMRCMRCAKYHVTAFLHVHWLTGKISPEKLSKRRQEWLPFLQRTSCVFPATTRDRRWFFFLFTNVCYSEASILAWNRSSNVFVEHSALKTTLRNVVSREKEATTGWVSFTFLLAVSLVLRSTRRNYNERMYDVQGLCARKIRLYRCAGKW